MSQFTQEINEYLTQMSQGDESSFDLLYEATAMHLYFIARKYLKNKNLAEDVVMDAFIKMRMYIHSYDCTQEGFNWLCRIVQHRAYDYNNKEKRIAQAESRYVSNLELTTDNSEFDMVEFMTIVDQLKEMDRDIVYQKYCEGKTFAQIGRAKNISRVAVYQRVSRLKKFMAKQYEKNDENK